MYVWAAGPASPRGPDQWLLMGDGKACSIPIT